MATIGDMEDLLRRAQEWLGDDISRRVPDFGEVKDELG